MPGPTAIILREQVAEGPTRRVVYHPLETGAYERKEQLWRAAIADWHTMGTEIVESLAIDAPEGRP
jgi:hypothetical protein